MEFTIALLKDAAGRLNEPNPLASLLDLARSSARTARVAVYQTDPRGNPQCLEGDDAAPLRQAVRHALTRTPGAGTILVPLKSAGKGLWLAAEIPNAADVAPGQAVLHTLTPMLSAAVRQSQLIRDSTSLRNQAERQERRYAELATLYDISRSLAATSGMQKAAEKVTELTARITDSDRALLLLFETDRDTLKAVHWTGISADIEKTLRWMTIPLPVPAAARAVTSPRLLRREDCRDLFGPEWSPVTRALVENSRSTTLVPLAIESTAVGLLLLGKQQIAYMPNELTMLSVASSQAAAVLRSALVYERHIGQRELELSAVFALIQRIRGSSSMEEALACILEIVGNIVWSERSALYTLDPDGLSLSVRAVESIGDSTGPDKFDVAGDSLPARALRARRALIAEEADDSLGTVAHSSIAIPLAAGDEMVGVLTLESSRPGIYTEDHAMMLHLVASQAATIYREISSYQILRGYTENILECIAAGVVTTDKNGTIVTWNARAAEIVNLRADQIIGLHYRTFIDMLQVDGAGRDETMAMVELTAQTGKVYTRHQLCYHSPQGDETYVNLNVSQLRSQSGDYLGVVVVFEDVTREIQMKEEVERIGKLAETGQLAANIAHELRNPLASIKAAAQLLRERLPEDSVDQAGEFVDIIVEEVNGLNRMATDFLDFSRISPPQLEAVDLNGILKRLVQSMSGYLATNNITFALETADDLPTCHADRLLLDQVVRNIVINAVQAMPDGGSLAIGIRLSADQEMAEIRFADTGTGIPASKLDKIWTPFFTTKTKGTGLGLAIARKIVDNHGGRISASSVPGVGSEFVIHLPVRPQTAGVWPPGRPEISERSDHGGGYFSLPGIDSPRETDE